MLYNSIMQPLAANRGAGDGGFQQDPPRLGNQLLDDGLLLSLLRRLLPSDVLSEAQPDLGKRRRENRPVNPTERRRRRVARPGAGASRPGPSLAAGFSWLTLPPGILLLPILQSGLAGRWPQP